MKRLFTSMAACLLTSAAVFADAPAGYYSSLDGKSGESLKNQLHDIIAPHTQLTYSSLWKYFPQTDAYPETVNGKLIVWDMYSDNWNTLKYFYYGGTRGLNREHSVPKSWWGNSGSSNSDIEKFLAGTDLMHLFPSDGPANSAKSNYPLGVVDVSTFSNGVSTVGYPVTGQGGGSSRVFEPDGYLLSRLHLEIHLYVHRQVVELSLTEAVGIQYAARVGTRRPREPEGN